MVGPQSGFQLHRLKEVSGRYEALAALRSSFVGSSALPTIQELSRVVAHDNLPVAFPKEVWQSFCWKPK
jgi:hypothetical protein